MQKETRIGKRVERALPCLLLMLGNLFLQETFKARDRIAKIGIPFIRDGTVSRLF